MEVLRALQVRPWTTTPVFTLHYWPTADGLYLNCSRSEKCCRSAKISALTQDAPVKLSPFFVTIINDKIGTQLHCAACGGRKGGWREVAVRHTLLEQHCCVK